MAFLFVLITLMTSNFELPALIAWAGSGDLGRRLCGGMLNQTLKGSLLIDAWFGGSCRHLCFVEF